MKLVDQGKINLDTPLNHYLGNNYDVVNDDRINLITARRVLSHTSGLPNWRENDHSKTLLIHFTPGSKYSYSGEGIVYLSVVVEKITGMPSLAEAYMDAGDKDQAIKDYEKSVELNPGNTNGADQIKKLKGGQQ